MPGKRDNAYWMQRLKSEHRQIYARFKSGEIPSVRQACAQAKLITLPSRVSAMQREYRKASDSERAKFIWWMSAFEKRKKKPVAAPDLVDISGMLKLEVIKEIHSLMDWMGIKPGHVNRGMGRSPSDPTLAKALRRINDPLKRDFLIRLGAWIARMRG